MREFDRDKFANDFEEEHGWCPDAGYEEINKTDSFADRFGHLTVEEIKELNEKARLTCEEDS